MAATSTVDHVSKCCMRAEIPDVQELPMGLFWSFRSGRENKIWSSKATAPWTLVSCPWKALVHHPSGTCSWDLPHISPAFPWEKVGINELGISGVHGKSLSCSCISCSVVCLPRQRHSSRLTNGKSSYFHFPIPLTALLILHFMGFN